MWAGAGAASAARWRPLLVLARLFGWVPLFLTQPRQQRFVEAAQSGCQAASDGTNSSVEQSPQPCVVDTRALQQSQRQRCCSFGSYLGCSSPTNCASAKRAKLQQSSGPSLHASVWIPGRSQSCKPCACFCCRQNGFSLPIKLTRACSIAGFLAVRRVTRQFSARSDPSSAFFLDR